MTLKNLIKNNRIEGSIGSLIVIGFTLYVLLFNTRLEELYERQSYNFLYDLTSESKTTIEDSEVVIVYMDALSHKVMNQPFNRTWSRKLHAELIDRLTNAGAKAIVFDVIFSDPGDDPQVDNLLADAMSRNGKVILGADYNTFEHRTDSQHSFVAAKSITMPYKKFNDASAGWGLAVLATDEDFVVRKHRHQLFEEKIPSLTWKTAEVLDLNVFKDTSIRSYEKYVRYYGPPNAIPNVSYSQAYNNDGVPNDFFKDKIVFIGVRPIAGTFIERRDEFRNPFLTLKRNFTFMPGVEVQATLLLNFIREDWLKRVSPVVELFIFVITSLLIGYGFTLLRPIPLTITCLILSTVFALAPIWLFKYQLIWFPWLLFSIGQIPIAWISSMSYKSINWIIQKRAFEEQRKIAVAQIHEQAALLDKANDAIFVLTLDWNVSYWNRSAKLLYGWDKDEINSNEIWRNKINVFNDVIDHAQEIVVSDGFWAGEMKQLNINDKEIIVNSRWTLVKDNDNNPESVLIINNDITEIRQLEQQFLRAQRMESLGTLAGGIAHDLNNILSPILLAGEMLRINHKDQFDPKFNRIVNILNTSAKRGASMVNQILTFARGSSNEKVTINLNHIIKEMEKIIFETFPKNIEFDINRDSDLKMIQGDPTQVHQILLNLCVNARDAMPDGGKIKISAQNVTLDSKTAYKIKSGRTGRFVLLSVADNGTGISQVLVKKIFDPFFTTKEEGKGTGLGLATVTTIIKQHNGFLNLITKPDVGTTFDIYFPQSEIISDSLEDLDIKEASYGRNEIVLVIEDEKSMREMTKSTLENYGYQVIVASDGAKGIELFLQNKNEVSAVIVDYMMPVMSGNSTIQALLSYNPELAILVISGLDEAEKSKNTFKKANLEYLKKPFTHNQLLNNVHQLLN